jgi:hypothetical protein
VLALSGGALPFYLKRGRMGYLASAIGKSLGREIAAVLADADIFGDENEHVFDRL